MAGSGAADQLSPASHTPDVCGMCNKPWTYAGAGESKFHGKLPPHFQRRHFCNHEAGYRCIYCIACDQQIYYGNNSTSASYSWKYHCRKQNMAHKRWLAEQQQPSLDDSHGNDDADFMNGEMMNNEPLPSIQDKFCKLPAVGEINRLPSTKYDPVNANPMLPYVSLIVDNDPDPDSQTCLNAGVNPTAATSRNRDIEQVQMPDMLREQLSPDGFQQALAKTAGIQMNDPTDVKRALKVLEDLLTAVLYHKQSAQEVCARMLLHTIDSMVPSSVNETNVERAIRVKNFASQRGWPTDETSMRALRDKLKSMVPMGEFTELKRRDGDDTGKSSGIWVTDLESLVALMAVSGPGKFSSRATLAASPGYLNAIYKDETPGASTPGSTETMDTIGNPFEAPSFLERKGSPWVETVACTSYGSVQ